MNFQDEGQITYGALLPIAEAAVFLGVSPNTLRAWVQEGKIESHKLFGRRLISEEEILRLREISRIPARSKTRSGVASLSTTTPDRVDR